MTTRRTIRRSGTRAPFRPSQPSALAGSGSRQAHPRSGRTGARIPSLNFAPPRPHTSPDRARRWRHHDGAHRAPGSGYGWTRGRRHRERGTRGSRALSDAFRRAEPGLRRGGCDDHGRDAGGAGRDRGAVSAGAVGAAADAAPGAERRRAGDAGRDRGLRGDSRADRGGGQRGGHLLHDVQAAAGRGLSRRGLHHRALRDHGRRRGVLGPARSSRDRQRRDDRGRLDHPRAHRVQCRLRLRPGDDGQLGVLRQHHAPEGDRRGRHDPRRPRDHRHPGGSGLHLAAGRTGARRLPRRPGRRRPDRGRTLPARSEHRPGARLVRTSGARARADEPDEEGDQ